MKRIMQSSLKGSVRAPHSKSAFQRAMALAALSEGVSHVKVRDLCEDDRAAVRAAEGLGARVREEDGVIAVCGGSAAVGSEIDCGESGLCLRVFSALAGLYDVPIRLTARGSLASRPMGMIAEALTQLGASCEMHEGRAPITIQGPLRGGNITVDASVSSQLLSGLLIALPLCERASGVEVTALASRPYIDLTLEMVRAFGGKIDADSALTRFVVPGGQSYQATNIEIEGDWSAAAFLLVAGAIAGSISVTGLCLNSLQADRAIIPVLEQAGAQLDVAEERIAIFAERLRGFQADATDCPDLFPPLVALAIHCQGKSRIEGVARLAHKESDRAKALCQEFEKLGARIEVEDDAMIVEGSTLVGGRVQSHGDHRIAMALTVAALKATGPVEVEGEACVAKSYPAFFEDMVMLGARCS